MRIPGLILILMTVAIFMSSCATTEIPRRGYFVGDKTDEEIDQEIEEQNTKAAAIQEATNQELELQRQEQLARIEEERQRQIEEAQRLERERIERLRAEYLAKDMRLLDAKIEQLRKQQQQQNLQQQQQNLQKQQQSLPSQTYDSTPQTSPQNNSNQTAKTNQGSQTRTAPTPVYGARVSYITTDFPVGSRYRCGYQGYQIWEQKVRIGLYNPNKFTAQVDYQILIFPPNGETIEHEHRALIPPNASYTMDRNYEIGCWMYSPGKFAAQIQVLNTTRF